MIVLSQRRAVIFMIEICRLWPQAQALSTYSCFSVVEAEHIPGTNPVQLGITFDSRAALEKAYALLVVGGESEMEPQQLPWSPWAACLRDRFGVRWFLSLPQHQPGEDFVPEK